MKYFATIFVVAAALLSASASAAIVDGVKMSSLGAPACYKPNPHASAVNGTFRPRLPDPDGDTHFAVNPWLQWPLPKFRGATYGALYGEDDAPSLVVYRFATPQTGVTLVWGTPDTFNYLYLLKNHEVIALINGGDVATAFGKPNGLNLTINLLSGTFDQATFQSFGRAFEWANLNAVCN